MSGIFQRFDAEDGDLLTDGTVSDQSSPEYARMHVEDPFDGDGMEIANRGLHHVAASTAKPEPSWRVDATEVPRAMPEDARLIDVLVLLIGGWILEVAAADDRTTGPDFTGSSLGDAVVSVRRSVDGTDSDLDA